MKKILIFKNQNTIIKPKENYLEFIIDNTPVIIAYKHISNIYINKTVDIDLKTLYKLSTKIDIDIIDHYGNLLSTIRKYSEN